ncbi:hypothetical protein FA13DRAFT_1804164 [Coprinellus micaceus]|uniref:Uncharacterized protein n=1 Tax=Coprinellus micaceus TaxID=71717 RepID=A0A4Y7SA06_COPMI|nr:hypothetical protein FA13DRAFT_1804164 [Coprinellus micaceus]
MSSGPTPVPAQLQSIYGLPELKALTLSGTCEEGQQAIDFFSSRGKASGRYLMQFEVGITHHLFSHLTLRFPSGITTPQFHREMTLQVLNLKPDADYIPVQDVNAAVSAASQHDPELLKYDFACDCCMGGQLTGCVSLFANLPPATLNSTIGNINMLTAKEILSYMDTLDEFKDTLDTQMSTTSDAMTQVWVELQRFQAISKSLEEDGQGLHPPLLDLQAPPEPTFSIPLV